VTEVPIFTTMAKPQPRENGTNRPLIRPSRAYAAGVWDHDEHGQPVRYSDPALDLIPYTRTSTLASYLDDQVGIRAWDLKNVALGIAKHDDLVGMIAGCEYGDENLERYIELARDRAGGNYKANLGTALHRMVEPPVDLENCPGWLRADAESYLAALEAKGIEQIEAEQFVVCDQIDDVDPWVPIQSAGTFDRIVYVPELEALGQNPRVALDIKTGQFHYRALAVQLTVYSHGFRYDHETEIRRPLDVNTRWALCAHVPQGKGKTTLRWIDLRTHGYRALRLTLALRQWRADPMPRGAWTEGPFTEWAEAMEAAMAGDPDLTDEELERVLATSRDLEELRTVWRANKDRITDRLATIATERAKVLDPNVMKENR
jgi:hypothetical protein